MLGGSHNMVAHLVAAGGCAPRGGGAGHVGQDHPALRAVVLAAQRGRLAAVEAMYPPLAARLQGEPSCQLLYSVGVPGRRPAARERLCALARDWVVSQRARSRRGMQDWCLAAS